MKIGLFYVNYISEILYGCISLVLVIHEKSHKGLRTGRQQEEVSVWNAHNTQDFFDHAYTRCHNMEIFCNG